MNAPRALWQDKADAIVEAVRAGRHWWAECPGFAGRICEFCGVDEDDQDDPRWAECGVSDG